MGVRVRFAPSPTGTLHVGGARTALFNFLFARKYKGQFILRVEDTDQERNQELFLKEQMKTLEWLHLFWDEGPKRDNPDKWKGSFGPYRQSQRLDIYKKYALQLLEERKAYYCFLSNEEIDQIKSSDQKFGQRIQSPYRDWSLSKALEKKDQGHKAVIRFKMPEVKKNYEIDDLVRRRVCFPSDMVGDFVLLRSNDVPVYNFCCAIDDALMEITHVFRAEEHLANTLRQLVIFEALGFSSPIFGHLSLILDTDKKKLSKRLGALSCLEYKEKGYLPVSLNNFLALLGWNPKEKREIFNLEELIEHFSEKKLNSAGAVFDKDKLSWINNKHIQSLPDMELWNELDPLLKKNKFIFPKEKWWKELSVSLLKTSFSNLNEAVEVFSLLAKDNYKISDSAEKITSWDQSQSVLNTWKTSIQKIEKKYLSLEDFKNIVHTMKKELNVKGQFLFMPIRVAIIGQPQGLELNQIIPLIDREELIKRVDTALEALF